MAYLSLYFNFSNSRSAKRSGLAWKIFGVTLPEQGEVMNEIIRQRHRNRLIGKMKTGRRWSFVAWCIPSRRQESFHYHVCKGCYSQVYMATAEKSVSHRRGVPSKRSESLPTHITRNYPKALQYITRLTNLPGICWQNTLNFSWE
jgi:hypothetical protein